MVLKICIFFLEMTIFTTIFDPTGKSWDDQIIYSHFWNVCKIYLQKIASLILYYKYTYGLCLMYFLYFSVQNIFIFNIRKPN